MQPTYRTKNKVYGLLSVVIFSLVLLSLSPSSVAQSLGENMGNPIIMGSYGGGTFSYTDTKNNGSYANDYGQASGDIFYKFTVQGSTEITISHCASASDFDTYMHLLNASGVEITHDDDDGPVCPGIRASISTTLAAGSYYIVSEGYYTNTGNIITDVSLTVQAPPVAADTRNFIKVWEATAPETDANTLLTKSLSDVKHSVTYFDGLGRPVQSIVKNGALSAGGNFDLVNPFEYDEFGREVKKYLPYASPSSDGLFKSNILAEQNAFYTGTSSPLAGQGEMSFFSKTNYEPSPLNRLEKAMAPGNSWVGIELGVQAKYYVNTATDAVRIWNVTNNATQGQFGAYSSGGAYAAGELYKNITIDEQGKQVIEFKDKEGKVILKKVQISTTAGTEDDGTGRGYVGWLSTYYLYDDLGNLRCVIQPEGVKAILATWSLTTALLNEQCFRYEYDQRNHMIMKKVPGAGEVYLVYDKRDRLAMTQDANLRVDDKWLVTLYDELNRPVQTGKLKNNWNNNKSFATHLADASASASVDYPFSTNAIPSVTYWEFLTKTGYDDYNTMPAESGLSSTLDNAYSNSTYINTSYNSAPYYPQQPIQSSQTKGMVTWSQVNVLGASTYLYSVNIYDAKGRLIQLKNKNITNGIDIVTTQYTWSGQPLNVVQKQENANAPAQTTIVISKMIYDALGRITQVDKKTATTLVNGGALPSVWTTIAKNEYNSMGQLNKKEVGKKKDANGNYTTTPIETLSYDYNIRGWLLGVNRNYLKDVGAGGFEQRYFGFELGYDKLTNTTGKAFTAQQFNGNITGMAWKSEGDQTRRKYDFGYDPANRLMKALFEQNDAGTSWSSNNVNYKVLMGSDGIDVASAYDANGNIKRMQQWGLKVTGSTQIDDMTYTYFTGSNKLQAVTEQGTGTTDHKLGDFTDKNTTATDYGYDKNGNLVTDLNKRLSGNTGTDLTSGGAISYNYLNLPTIIATKKDDGTTSKGTITYTYDAAGNKLKKQTIDYSTNNKTITTTTTYLGGQVFESKTTVPANSPNDDYADKLQFIGQEEGRVRFTAAVDLVPAKLDYDYFIKDHLGNVRMVLTDEVKSDVYPNLSFEGAANSTEVNNQAAIWEDAGGNAFDVVGKRTSVQQLVNATSLVPETFANSLLVRSSTGKVGAGKLIKVMSGDKINTTVQYYFSQNTENGSTNNLNTLVAGLASVLLNSAGSLTALKANPTGIANSVSTDQNAIDFFSPQNVGVNNGRPKAYLNVLFFDEQFKFDKPNSYSEQISAANNPGQIVIALGSARQAKKNGYCYIYISNETNDMVYFDNFTLKHERSSLIEETHYYPFGLIMAGISSKAAGNLINKKGYNGNELESREFSDGSGLELYDFNARTYDQQLGRFIQIDPNSEEADQESWNPYHFSYNNPIRYNDPDGEFPIETIWDVGNLLWDAGKAVVKHIQGDHKAARASWVDAGADLVATLLPYVPAGTTKLYKAADKVVDGVKVAKKGGNITENAKKGKDFEKVSKADLNQKGHKNIAEQVTVENSAGRTIMDKVSTKEGKIHLREDKSSKTARLNPNQKRVHKAIEKEGGVIRGKKGGDVYPAGTQIPPTKVEINRPN